MPAFNAKFACPAQEDGTAFVPWIGGNLDDILMELLAIRLSQQTTLA